MTVGPVISSPLGSVLAPAIGEGSGLDPIRAVFADGTDGFYFDFSKLAKLWQNTAGTTPVAAAGNNIARSDDSSPRGNSATQATTAAQPKWQTGGLARFDGSDDNLLSTLKPSATAMTLVADVLVGTAGNATVLMGCIGAGTQRLSLGFTVAGVLAGSLGNQFSSTILDAGAVDRSGQRLRAALTCDGTTVRLYANGVQVYSGAQSGAPATDQDIAVGAYNNAGAIQSFSNADMYKALAIKKALTAAEIVAITNEWGTS